MRFWTGKKIAQACSARQIMDVCVFAACFPELSSRNWGIVVCVRAIVCKCANMRAGICYDAHLKLSVGYTVDGLREMRVLIAVILYKERKQGHRQRCGSE
jgi:hypothetical protein